MGLALSEGPSRMSRNRAPRYAEQMAMFQRGRYTEEKEVPRGRGNAVERAKLEETACVLQDMASAFQVWRGGFVRVEFDFFGFRCIKENLETSPPIRLRNTRIFWCG